MDSLSRFGKTLRLAVATSALSMLAACGGGEPEARKTPASAELRESAAALPLPATRDADAFFEWVEQLYPQHFPPGAVTQSIVFEQRHYTVRHYPATGNYVGLMDGGLLRAMGPFTGGALASYGPVEPYLCEARPALCQRITAPTAHVVVDAGGRQCEPTGVDPLLAARARLTDAGIAVARSDCGLVSAGLPAVCGASDGRYWIFEIPAADVERAVALGYGRPDSVRPAKAVESACAW